MNWLALTPAEVAAVWSALAALALWLYLHHRRPQHRRVSTLRFWASVQPVAQPRRRRLREPWALLAQVLFLLFLILALANPRWGVTSEGRSVVIVLDTSIWSQVRPAGASAWIDTERQEAQRVLDSLPSADRVLLLPAEADAPPILPFTTDRGALRRAIAEAPSFQRRCGYSARARNGQGRAWAARGAGCLFMSAPECSTSSRRAAWKSFARSMENPDDNRGQPQFLVRLVGGDAPVQNRGITRLSLRRDAAQPDLWHLLTQLKNYSDTKTNVVLKLSVSGQPLGQRAISLSPGELANAENEFTWARGGLLQAEISPSDALEADDRAVVNLPTFRVIRVAVFPGNSPFPSGFAHRAFEQPLFANGGCDSRNERRTSRPMSPFTRVRACLRSRRSIPFGFSADPLRPPRIRFASWSGTRSTRSRAGFARTTSVCAIRPCSTCCPAIRSWLPRKGTRRRR